MGTTNFDKIVAAFSGGTMRVSTLTAATVTATTGAFVNGSFTGTATVDNLRATTGTIKTLNVTGTAHAKTLTATTGTIVTLNVTATGHFKTVTATTADIATTLDIANITVTRGKVAIAGTAATGSIRWDDSHGSLGGPIYRSDDTEWDDLRVPLTTTKLGGTQDPAFEKFRATGASQGVFSYAFAANREEEVYFVAQMPHRWKVGTDLRPHIHWSPSSASTGVIRVGLEYTVANLPTDVFPTTSIVYATAAAGGTALMHQPAMWATMAAGALTASCLFICRLFRTPTNGADTYPAKIYIHDFDIHYQVNRQGTFREFTDTLP